MFAKLGRAVTARPWLVIGAWVVIAAAIIGFAPRIGGVTNSDQSAFLPATAESARAAALARAAFPEAQGATAVIAVTRTDKTALAPADVDRIAEVAGPLRADSVAGVQFDPA